MQTGKLMGVWAQKRVWNRLTYHKVFDQDDIPDLNMGGGRIGPLLAVPNTHLTLGRVDIPLPNSLTYESDSTQLGL